MCLRFTANLGPFAQGLLVIFLVLNLAGAGQSVALELEPSFFLIGYGIQEGSRVSLHQSLARRTLIGKVVLGCANEA